MSQQSRVEAVKSLQNGIDLRGIIPTERNEKDGPLLSCETAYWVGYGFGRWLLSQGGGKRVGVGRDPRVTGEELTKWLAGGLQYHGIEVIDLGLCTTPAVYYACREDILKPLFSTDSSFTLPFPWPLDAGIAVTASHLPRHWNGFKMFTANTPVNIGQTGIDGIIDALHDDDSELIKAQPHPVQNLTSISFLPLYSRFLQQTIRNTCSKPLDERPLTGLKVCVNAGNGAGGFFATTLAELGADTAGSLHLDPDGKFPNHVANPEDKEAIEATSTGTVAAGADVGVCLDTDADRVGLVDRDGALFNRNKLVALVGKIAIQDFYRSSNIISPSGQRLGARPVIVTDSATSTGLHHFVEDNLVGTHLRYKKGYRYVIELARNTPNAVAAVECSGHGAWLENGWVDDGCYTAARVIASLVLERQRKCSEEQTSVSLSSMVEGLVEPVESIEIRCNLAVSDKKMKGNVVERVIEAFRGLAGSCRHWELETTNYEGIRANVLWKQYNGPDKVHLQINSAAEEGGWCMLRPSLHEPILSIQIESDLRGGTQVLCKELFHALNQANISEVDLTNLLSAGMSLR